MAASSHSGAKAASPSAAPCCICTASSPAHPHARCSSLTGSSDSPTQSGSPAPPSPPTPTPPASAAQPPSTCVYHTSHRTPSSGTSPHAAGSAPGTPAASLARKSSSIADGELTALAASGSSSRSKQSTSRRVETRPAAAQPVKAPRSPWWHSSPGTARSACTSARLSAPCANAISAESSSCPSSGERTTYSVTPNQRRMRSVPKRPSRRNEPSPRASICETKAGVAPRCGCVAGGPSRWSASA
ncbi:hypothetical protein T492DRAFT_1033657 [Pavlovales sp. CCMP2436]|nr:hypothetical protein T492DRAFT_1033657 [Pavlovales sp. CCMP2436]